MNGTKARLQRATVGPGLLWGAVAVAAGAIAAQLPLAMSGLFLAGGVAGVGLLVEPALAIMVMVAVAPLKALISTEVSAAFPLDVGQAALLVALLAWGAWRVSSTRQRTWPVTWVLAPLLIILAGFMPSLWYAASVSAWLTEWAKWIAMAALAVVVFDLARTGRGEWIAFGVVWSALLQALLGLYQFYGGSGAPHLWIDDYRHFRAFGTFGQPNPFSGFMGLVLPLTLGLAGGYAGSAWHRWRGGKRIQARLWAAVAWWYGGCALILLAGLIASWGRGAWLGFGVAVMVMVFFAPRWRWHGVLLIGILAVLALVIWVSGLLPAPVQARLDSAFADLAGWRDVRGAPLNDANYATLERLAHWQAAAAMASAHLWTGVGLGNYEVVYPAYALPRWPHALGHAHNEYLNTLAETGLVGMVGYLLGWALIVAGTVRALRQRDPLRRGIALGLLGTWSHFATHSLVDKLTVNNLFLHLGVMLGLLAWVSEGIHCTAFEGWPDAHDDF